MERKSKRETTLTLQPRWRVAAGKEIAVGPGKADLLEFISETGSIGKAAGKMGMSYMRAWLLIKTMNDCFPSPVVITERGGRTRGGAALTDAGREVLRLYRRIEKNSLQAIQPEWRALQKLLRD